MMDTTEQTQLLQDETVEEREEEVPEASEVPTKCVSTWQNFHVKANVQWIDFEGRTEGESIKKLLWGLKPRRVILVRGEERRGEERGTRERSGKERVGERRGAKRRGEER